MWGRFSIVNGTYVQTGNWLGLLDVALAPWTWAARLDRHLHIPDQVALDGMGWVYLP